MISIQRIFTWCNGIKIGILRRKDGNIMDAIEKLIHDEKKQAMYEEESLVDLLFDKEDLLESGESL